MIFENLLSKRSTTPGHVDHSSGGMAMYQPTVSGEKVDADTAQTFSAWWGCVRGISETIAYLPWQTMERNGKNKKLADSHPLFSLLHTMPNEEMNSFNFRELILRQVLSEGNFYGEVERNRLGNIVNVWPIENDRVNLDRDNRGRLVYDISNGMTKNTTFKPKDIYHIKGPGNGVVGLSVVSLAKETISLGIAAEKFGGGLFGNGAMPSLVITDDGSKNLKADGIKNLLKSWNSRNQGARNSRKTEYLEKGFDVKQISINPNDAQFLETRKFQVHEVCRWFRYPVHKLAELDRSTNNNIEAENIAFVTDTLMPWICRIEKETDISLFRREEVGQFYNKLVVQGLLRGDLKSRADFYSKMWGMGVFSIDDILELEDRQPLDGGAGELRMVPLNMVSVEQAHKQGNTIQQKQGLTKSHFRLAQNIAQRFVTIETKRLETMATKESFKEDAIKFYSNQSENMINAFRPACGLAFEALGKNSGIADEFTTEFVKDLILDSADSAQGARNSGKLDILLQSWSVGKAESVAEKLINKVVNYA